MLLHSHRYWRFLETIPGAIAWTALIAPLLLSVFYPEVVASFIICYTILWLFKSLILSVNLLRSYRLTKKALKENWMKKLEFINSEKKLSYAIKKEKDKKRRDKLINLQDKIRTLKEKHQLKNWKKVYHAIIFVTYKESLKLIRESIKSYANSTFPSKQIIFVFAGEERDLENVLKYSKILKKELGNKFAHFMTTIHPKDIPGEIRGKSANATYAAKQLKKIIDNTHAPQSTAGQEKIPYENIIVSNFDADTVVHPQYFAELTYKYITETDRTEKTYQPTHMYHNNIWDVPVMVRLVALACTFWRMAESMNKEKYKSFSSRSIGLKTVIDTNYWDPAVIPEDSRQFWTAYLKYDGRHKLVPIHCPLYMDAVLSETYIKTFKSQYNQLRRWAWGVCDFPFVAINLAKHKKISLFKKIYCISHLLENHFFWATAPILITFTGWLPSILNPKFQNTVISYYLPNVTSSVLTLASVGILMCIFVSFLLIPEKPDKKSVFSELSLIFQWFLVPIVSIFLSAIPALDAQTRLMFGKYLEYKVTEKTRVEKVEGRCNVST